MSSHGGWCPSGVDLQDWIAIDLSREVHQMILEMFDIIKTMMIVIFDERYAANSCISQLRAWTMTYSYLIAIQPPLFKGGKDLISNRF